MPLPSPDKCEWDAAFGAAMCALATHDYPTAINGYRRAVELAEQLHPAGEPLAKTLHYLAMTLTYADGTADAGDLLNRAREIRLNVLAEKEASLGAMHLEVAECCDNLAESCGWQREPDAAIAFHKRALAIRIHAFGEDHYDVAMTLNCMANSHWREHDRDAAAQVWQRAVAILDRLHENPETDSQYVGGLLRSTMQMLGLNAYERKDDAAAEAWFRLIALMTGDEFGLPGMAPIYAKVLVRLRKFEEAEVVLNAASKISMRATAWKEACQEALIDLYNATGRHAEAEAISDIPLPPIPNH